MFKECDVLIPAATEKAINIHNAHQLQCRILAEAANGPTTKNAEQVLEDKGILILPDVLTNAGGVTVSYFEYLKNLDHVNPGLINRKWEETSKLRFL
jgi:glutamate dehydrogenase (NAD(P)+)